GAFDRDIFITPSFNLTSVFSGTGKLEFKLSAASRATVAGDMTDSLKVQYSTNCGNTWLSFPSNAGTFTGAALNNAGSWQEAYTPSLQTQWTQKSIALPAAALSSNVRFRFLYVSGDNSNNIYIDDVNISGSVGIEDNNPGLSADLSVFPNPAADDVSVT